MSLVTLVAVFLVFQFRPFRETIRKRTRNQRNVRYCTVCEARPDPSRGRRKWRRHRTATSRTVRVNPAPHVVTFWSLRSDQIGRRGGSLAPTVASRPEEPRAPGVAPVAIKYVPPTKARAAVAAETKVHGSTYISPGPEPTRT